MCDTSANHGLELDRTRLRPIAEGPMVEREIRIIGVELNVDNVILPAGGRVNRELEMFACKHTLPVGDSFGSPSHVSMYQGRGGAGGQIRVEQEPFDRPVAVITIHTSQGDRAARIPL